MILSLGIYSQTKGHKSNLKKSDIESESMDLSARFLIELIFYKDGKFKQQIEFGCQSHLQNNTLLRMGFGSFGGIKSSFFIEPNFQNE